jgi:branched-chain amino acid aminotransferase
MAGPWPVYSPEELLGRLKSSRRPWHDAYLTMFSTAWGGFSANPEVWGVPPDDHMVHRADGIFEFFKVVGGRAYCLDEHLARLANSAAVMGIKLPPEIADIRSLVSQAWRLGGIDDFAVRLTVSRGPGSFTVNPYDCPAPQLYLVTMRLKRPTAETYERGIRLATAPFPAQTDFAEIKTCDYLHNVLAKKAAIDAGGDYPICFDQDGRLTEGATENVAVVTTAGELLAPPYTRILKGVTLGRILDLGRTLVDRGLIKSVANRDLTREELPEAAAEIFLTSTSFDVLGAASWDGRPVGDGRPGPVTRALTALIDAEVHTEGPHSVRLD